MLMGENDVGGRNDVGGMKVVVLGATMASPILCCASMGLRPQD